MEADFLKRCQEAIDKLKDLKEKHVLEGNNLESTRLVGKIDGVALAMSYYEEMLREYSKDYN
jgi:predicted Zn-dependent protease with MMP-like domain